MRPWKRILIGFVMAAACFSQAVAQTVDPRLELGPPTISSEKAAFIFNIIKFVEWPAARSVVEICIRKKSSMWHDIFDFDGFDIGKGRIMSVSEVNQGASCDIEFVDDLKLLGFTYQTEGQSPRVLSVSDVPGALSAGLAIQIYLDADEINFAVNTRLVRDAQYEISSKLLRLARPQDVSQ